MSNFAYWLMLTMIFNSWGASEKGWGKILPALGATLCLIAVILGLKMP